MIVSNAFHVMELPRDAACSAGAEAIVADWLRLRNQRMAAMRFDRETYHQAGVSALRPPPVVLPRPEA
jgi:hypothetical protein